jgi:hypothetical protein
MRTRGLQALTAKRIATEVVGLVYPQSVEAGDGSATITNTTKYAQASVGRLQPKDIERIEKGGNKVKKGIMIVLPDTWKTEPDTVTYNDKSYRVVEWNVETEDNDFDNFSNTIVATCDEIQIAGVSL